MATFTEEFTRMRQDFDQAQADRHQLFDDYPRARAEHGPGRQGQLAGFRQNMRNMHDEIAEMAGQVRTELKEMSTDLHTGGDIFRKGSSPKISRERAIKLLAAPSADNAIAADGHSGWHRRRSRACTA